MQNSKEWKVYLDCGFGKYDGTESAGEEMPVGSRFRWQDAWWQIPSVYVCKDGLVADILKEIEPRKMRQFVKRLESSGFDEKNLSHEDREKLEAENPLNVHLQDHMTVNGVALHRRRGCSMCWIPKDCQPEGMNNRQEEKWASIMEHYGLDPEKAWVIVRHSYHWEFQRKPVISQLDVSLAQHSVPVTVHRFRTPENWTTFLFTHPVTGMEHKVIIEKSERQRLDTDMIKDNRFEYPTHFVSVSYTVSPKLPYGEFFIQDCAQGDGACSVVFLSEKKGDGCRIACSSLYFEPVEDVEWKMVCMVKIVDDIEVTLVDKNARCE